ncbi:MAG: hypothetical protein WDN28_12965 [Chthoniobacter sp.]
MRSPSTKLLDAAPGHIVTASVVVANRGADDEFVERLTLPPGCQKVAPPDLPFRLEAGGQIVRVLAVLVPANMPAGRYDLHYAAQSRRDPSSSGSLDLAIQVTPVDDLELVVEPQANLVLAGDLYPVKLHVTNRGNSRLAVQLIHRSSLGFLVSVDAGAFALAAGATREIACTVQTDKAFAQHTHHAVTFDVTATSTSGKILTASQASVVEIIPLVSHRIDPFHEFPIQLRLIGIAETGHDAQFQAEISGAGSLDEAGHHRIDFVFRGPDVQNASLFGERDEYGASYHGDHWDVDLGDRVYALSPLTEKHSLGRGAGVTWHDDGTTAGVFTMSTRYRQENTEEIGAFVRRDITPQFSLQGNFLRKTGGDQLSAQALPQDIVSLESHYHVGKLFDLDLESGVSHSDEGVTDYAWRAEAHGELPGKVSYAIEHVHAGQNFNGYYGPADTTYASVTKAITPKFHVHASLSDYAGNPAFNDVLSTVVNRENLWNAGLDYALTKETGLSLEWQHVKRVDILLPSAYDFTADSLRLGASHNFGKLQMQSFLDLGTLENSLTRASGPFQRYSATLNWTPTTRQTYSVFASYGPSAFTGATDQSLGAGVSARWQIRDNCTANVSYARNQYNGLIGTNQDQALASICYQREDKSSISLVGRWSRTATKDATTDIANEAAILVTYSIPLNLSVSRKRSIGGLQGRLYDVTKGREAGLPRVVLQVGEQFAVTNGEGIFEFPSLKPGACELKVVLDSLGARMTMATPLPLKIKIRPAETSSVELAATPACSVSLRVMRYEFADGNALTASSALREAGGQEAVAVEITNGRDVWRAQTDRTGYASFDRLPGGPWTLRVASSDLPALHTIENPERTLLLQPGETQQVALRILPQHRTLRLLDHGTIR